MVKKKKYKQKQKNIKKGVNGINIQNIPEKKKWNLKYYMQ